MSSRTGSVTLATVRTVASAPFTRRARREAAFCLLAAVLGCAALLVPFVLAGPAALAGRSPRGTRPYAWAAVVVLLAGIAAVALLVPAASRGLGALRRRLASRLLGARVAPPDPLRAGRGPRGRAAAMLTDAVGWRSAAGVLLTLPLAFAEGYAVFLWFAGLADVSYPFWWGLFRNAPPGVRLSPLPGWTPFPGRVFPVATYPGTFVTLAVGAVMLLAAPWVSRAAAAVDVRLIRRMFGPGGLAQRVADLETTRALAVDDAAARLRQVERDLHDGAQIRLATLGMTLGMAREKLGRDGEAPDLAAARELIDASVRGTRDILAELRDLARGIHPPILDAGLAEALAGLAATSAVPVELSCDLPARPTPAIETIAYFCASELLANAVKHSGAHAIAVRVAEDDGVLRLHVSDDGVGGAHAATGGGLAGLAQRVRTVDGRLALTSPPGGPTRITVELPLRAAGRPA